MYCSQLPGRDLDGRQRNQRCRLIVGGYCLRGECATTGEGELGFVLNNVVYSTFTFPAEFAVGLASINDEGVLMGNYVDGEGLVYTFLATPTN